MHSKHPSHSIRAHQSHTRRRAAIVRQATSSAPGAAAAPGRDLAPGGRVLDLETGSQGTIEAAAADHLVNAAGAAKRVHSYTVRLADGSTVTRSKAQLAALPPALVTGLMFPPIEGG